MNVYELSLETKQLHRKFIKDFNLPLQVVQEPYFSERLKYLEEDYGANTNYLNLLETIRDHFGSHQNKFMEYGHSLADRIVGDIVNSDAYKKDFLRLLPTKQEIEQHNRSIKDKITNGKKLYTQEQDGCMFVSFDMKKANFQLIRYTCPAVLHDAKTYEEYISNFTDFDYFKFSKGLRQAIFGKVSPKEVSQAELCISSEFFLYMNGLIGEKYEPYSINNDEVIFKFKGTEEEFLRDKLVDGNDVEFKGITFRATKFILHSRVFQLATSDQQLVVFEKEDILKAHKRTLACCPATYHPQVYKALRGVEIGSNDLVFYYEHELCKFMYPIKLIK